MSDLYCTPDNRRTHLDDNPLNLTPDEFLRIYNYLPAAMAEELLRSEEAAYEKIDELEEGHESELGDKDADIYQLEQDLREMTNERDDLKKENAEWEDHCKGLDFRATKLEEEVSDYKNLYEAVNKSLAEYRTYVERNWHELIVLTDMPETINEETKP